MRYFFIENLIDFRITANLSLNLTFIIILLYNVIWISQYKYIIYNYILTNSSMYYLTKKSIIIFHLKKILLDFFYIYL